MPDTVDATSNAAPANIALDAAFDATAVRRWCDAALVGLRAHQHEIDQLNVYPVPDGDTGTNLALTMGSARAALAGDDSGAGESVGGVLRLIARGALLGARGNSGVIVAQILRGLADGLPGDGPFGGKDLAAALRTATEAAYAAVAEPVEGTILSVVAAAAEAAAGYGSDDPVTVAGAAAAAAATALARTPSQLPALAAAGVVDAGGRGLCVLLDALVEALAGAPVEPAGSIVTPSALVRHAESSTYGYEVQYLLEADAAAVETLKAELGTLGDSLVVVGDPPTWNVHVHVDDVGRAIEAGVEAGRPYRISVTRFADQAARPRLDEHRRAVVVVADGDGLAKLFAAEGAAVVGANPSIAEILAVIRATGAARVVLLPDDRNRHAVATSAAREAATVGVRVSVVPTRSPVQALAALAVRDADRAFSEDVIAMAEAAGACRYGEVGLATREALTVAGRCRPGDVLGLVEGEVHLIGADLLDVGRDLLDRMLGGGGELVTLLIGADVPPGFDADLRAHVAQNWPFAEVNSFPGGQPRFPLLVGVE